jgi:hypothetical protein
VHLYADESEYSEAVQVVAKIANASERLRQYIAKEFKPEELS